MATAAKAKIVVIEDEGLIAADLQARLSAAGYTVPGTADSAPQALELIRKTSPDLVLMDIRLKGEVDGIQIADEIRRQMDIPVIYLTAYEDRATLERASQTQAFGYIKKPIASSSLRGSIEVALAKHSQERQVRAQRDWLAASLAAVPFAVLVTDSSGAVGYINSLTENLTGWSADQALGRPVSHLLRLYYRDSGEPVDDFLPVAILNGEPLGLPSNILLKGQDGRSYAVEGGIAPRWQDGRIQGTVIALRDVTQGEFEQDQARRESKQQALRRLADGITRELPDMSTLAQQSVRLMDGLAADSPLRAEAQGIERAALDAFGVMHRVQTLLAPVEVQLGRVLLNELLTRLAEAWKQIYPGLVLTLHPEPLEAEVDEWQLTRTLASMLQHARAHMAEGSQLKVESSLARAVEPASVLIRVTYRTDGEDAASVERLFEPSYSATSSELPTAYAVIQQMGGRAAARLEEGDRVTFEIYLKRVGTAASAIPEADKPAVLLIESNPAIRQLLHVHLEAHGYRLLEASDADQALLLARLYRAPIPLVIANSGPGDSDLHQKLSALRPECRVRMVAGYREAAIGGAGSAATRALTRWDLLAWVEEAFRALRRASEGLHAESEQKST